MQRSFFLTVGLLSVASHCGVHCADAQDAGAQSADGPSVQAVEIDARAEFQPCTTCHGRPDSELTSGKLWIGRVAKTSCVQPVGPKSAPLRRALRDYLLGTRDVAGREAKAREPGAGDGRIVLAHAEQISMLLVPEGEGAAVRLLWKAEQAAESRTLPVGKYRVQHYAITRRDRQGVEWHLWGSGPKGRKITVTTGEPTRIDFNRRVLLSPRAQWTRRGLRVGLAPTGDSRMGVTIMRAGKRIPATYRVFGSEGITAEGSMAYG